MNNVFIRNEWKKSTLVLNVLKNGQISPAWHRESSQRVLNDYQAFSRLSQNIEPYIRGVRND